MLTNDIAPFCSIVNRLTVAIALPVINNVVTPIEFEMFYQEIILIRDFSCLLASL